MRAFYLREDSIPSLGDVIVLNDDRAHHLIKVCRIKKDEQLKALDGVGNTYLCEVLQIGRRDCSLKVISISSSMKGLNVDLLLGLPKREAFELSLKNSVELGVSRLIPFYPKYGQWKIKNFDRVNQLIESSIIQSNNPYYLNIDEPLSCIEDSKILCLEYDAVILTTLKAGRSIEEMAVDKSKKYLIVIGPEGGLSEQEEDFILSLDNSYALQLDMPILRTPNAVSTAVGFMHGKFAGL